MVGAHLSTVRETDLLEQVVEVARRAGDDIGRGLEPRTDWKPDGSPVTLYDRRAHQVIVSALSAIDPSIPIVSEESGVPPMSERSGWTHFWLVDPLDGTREFVEKLPDYTVNIALIEHGVPALGVVYAPAREVTYSASRSTGAFRHTNDAPPVRLFSRPPAPGAPLRLVESRAHRSPDLDAFARGLRVAERVAVGSSLKFCRLAEGRADLYPRFTPVMEWDVAAGDCVFRWSSPSADPHYSPLTYNTPDMRLPGFVVGFMPPAPAVVWFTGLPAAGKTPIVRLVREHLARLGSTVELLNGNEVRAILRGGEFSREELDTRIRLVGETASRLERHGVTSLVSLDSSGRDFCDVARRMCGRFVEVDLSRPVEECDRRDLAGPELRIDMTSVTAEAAAERVIEYLLQR